ncbi:Leukocyte immunoglobulin-like receptor subfamily A member 6 [Camelus dromedarius]|uniref:Leukocyte immunoglobulin-like receptor subfamily A member 6 n=1 Tax=Camelus dromedarius TaxID=9838 RepID=A0A5N4DV59_CAMDR|nr:Leukocyte immunoglobulin-like receptor subfamily A member 6 [Camelus dromedarius]
MTGKPASLRTHPVGLRAEGTVSPPSAQPGPQGGGAMTPTLTALLCLGEIEEGSAGESLTGTSLPGLSVGVRTQVQAGTLPKPTIWAEPGSVIPWGRPVTIWCQGTLGAQEFRLHKEGSLARWDTQRPLEPGDKATFSISYMTEHNTGRYRCYYHSLTGRSQDSDALVLRMSGEELAGQ